MAGVRYLQPPRPLISGEIAPGAELDLYIENTSTRAIMYADIGLTRKLPNPLQADVSGRFPPIYTATGAYDAEFSDANGTQILVVAPIATQQPFGILAQPLGIAGESLPEATMTFYAADTTILQDVYTNSGMGTPLENPLEADLSGNFSAVYLDEDLSYRVILKDADGVLLYDITVQGYPEEV